MFISQLAAFLAVLDDVQAFLKQRMPSNCDPKDFYDLSRFFDSQAQYDAFRERCLATRAKFEIFLTKLSRKHQDSLQSFFWYYRSSPAPGEAGEQQDELGPPPTREELRAVCAWLEEDELTEDDDSRKRLRRDTGTASGMGRRGADAPGASSGSDAAAASSGLS